MLMAMIAELHADLVLSPMPSKGNRWVWQENRRLLLSTRKSDLRSPENDDSREGYLGLKGLSGLSIHTAPVPLDPITLLVNPCGKSKDRELVEITEIVKIVDGSN